MFIPEVRISREQLARLKRERSHWNAVAKILYAKKLEHEILEMLVVEMHTHNRPYVKRRIYSHFNAVRRKNELEELANYNVQEQTIIGDSGE